MKSIFGTKSFWAGLATIITGVGLALHGDIDTGLQTIATGIATIVIRDAIVDVQNRQ